MTAPGDRDPRSPLVEARLTTANFPPYRYLPGRNPHPRRDPGGHSFGRAEPAPRALPASGARDERFRFAVDLYNGRFFWEAHEEFEAFWRIAPRASAEADLLQGIIQIAAANLKREMAPLRGQALAERGLVRLARVPDVMLGVDVRAFERDARAYFEGTREDPAALLLIG